MNSLNALQREIQSQRIVSLTVFGTLFHWYSFYVLGILMNVVVKDQLGLSTEVTTYFTTTAFIVGFFVRPLGSIIFSPQIDTSGRKALFNKSLFLIFISLVIVLIFPFTWFSPYIGLGILIISRLLQGVAISMEYGSALAYIYESVPHGRSGFFVSMLQMTAPLGYVGAYIISLIAKLNFEGSSWESWSWRFPLLIGVILFLISLQIRIQLPESLQYEKIKKKFDSKRKPLLIFLRNTSKKDLLYVFFGVAMVQGVLYYFIYSYMRSYLINGFNVDSARVSFFIVTVTTLTWPIILFVGALSDRYKPKKLFLGFLWLNLFVILLSTYVIENYVVASSEIWLAFIPVIFIFISTLSIYSLTGRILVEIFPTQIRGTGVSVPYHVGNGIFGGMILLIPYFNSNNGGESIVSEKTYLYIVLLIAIAINHYYFHSSKKLAANS